MSGWEEMRREIEALPDMDMHPGAVARAAVLAAIDRAALSGSTAPLDRERLAEALFAAWPMRKLGEERGRIVEWKGDKWLYIPHSVKADELVDAIAAEYAHLAAASPDPAQGET